MGEAEHVMVWTFHHLMSDARSSRHLLQELFACYEGRLAGLRTPTP
jgi:NRPS condensation-like uncharacterized protein